MGLTLTRIAAPVDQLDTGEIRRELGSLIAFRPILPAQRWFVIDVVRREHSQARLSEIADKLQLLAENVGMPSLLAHVEDSDCSLVLGVSAGEAPAQVVFNPDLADDYGGPAEMVERFPPHVARLREWSATVGLPRLEVEHLERLVAREWLEAAEPVEEIAQRIGVALLASPAYIELQGLLQIDDARVRVWDSSYKTTETRYAWGKGDGFYGIWDRRNPGPPIQRFTNDKDGRVTAYRTFMRLLAELPEDERTL